MKEFTKDDNKNKILEAMFHLVAKQGYEKTSMREIAETAGMQKPSLYYYFKSKEEIFLETIANYYDSLMVIQEEDLEEIDSPEAYQRFLVQVGVEYFKSFEENQELQQFYCEVNLQSLRIPSLGEYFVEYEAKEKEIYRKLIEKGQSFYAITQSIQRQAETELMYATILGLTEMVLYGMKVDASTVWQYYAESLMKKNR